VVWCSAGSDSALLLWCGLFGPWSRGAEVVLQEGPLDAVERLELVHRLGVTVLCQRPAEYRALAESGHLARFRSVRPRRLLSTGDRLGGDLVAHFEEQWGLTIHDGYGQAETGIVAGHTAADGYREQSVGRALPGYGLAVVDEGGRPVLPGEEGELALQGRPPSLFAGYWNAPAETKAAFRGDWYLTGDAAAMDEDGCVWLIDRTSHAVRRPDARPAPMPVRPRAPAVEKPVVAAVPPPAPEAPQAIAPRPAVEPRPTPVSEPRPTPVSEPRPTPGSDPLPPEPARAPEPVKRAAPVWARATAVVWLLLLGVLVGGAAIPHANDEPRVVQRQDDAPNAICLPPKPRG
jgi:hypothetical protein